MLSAFGKTVISVMLTFALDLKIVESVVLPVFIFVMNLFVVSKQTT